MAEAEQATEAEVTTGEVAEGSDFSALLTKEFKPKSERAKEEVESAVQTLAEFVLKDTSLVSDDAIASIESIIAQIDSKLTEQINKILHHEDFKKLEG